MVPESPGLEAAATEAVARRVMETARMVTAGTLTINRLLPRPLISAYLVPSADPS